MIQQVSKEPWWMVDMIIMSLMSCSPMPTLLFRAKTNSNISHDLWQQKMSNQFSPSPWNSNPYPTNQIGTAERSFQRTVGNFKHTGITRIESSCSFQRQLWAPDSTWEGEAANLWNWYTATMHSRVVKKQFQDYFLKFVSKRLSNKVLSAGRS